jgi:hypothetical protein
MATEATGSVAAAGIGIGISTKQSAETAIASSARAVRTTHHLLTLSW